MSPDGELEVREGRSTARPRRPVIAAALAVVLLAPLVSALASPAWAGCAVPEPALWSPLDEGAPLNSRVTVSLGGMAGLVRAVELRAVGGGAAIAVRPRELAGPTGHAVLELTPEAPLEPGATYELVARRPQGWHPSQWIFGAFTTSRVRDDVAPELRVLGGRFLRGRGDGRGRGRVREWVELEVALRDGERAGGRALYAVWFPGASGALDTSGPPDAHVPGPDLPERGGVLRLSSPDEECPELALPLPSAPGQLEIGLAALDAAGNRSAPQRISLDVPPLAPDPER